MDHKSAIAAAVNSPRFRIDDCIDFEDSLAPAQAQEYAIIKRKLTPKEFKELLLRQRPQQPKSPHFPAKLWLSPEFPNHHLQEELYFA